MLGEVKSADVAEAVLGFLISGSASSPTEVILPIEGAVPVVAVEASFDN